MCSIKDAQREEKLASLFSQENNHAEAIAHYLEACSIYLLNSELEKKKELKWLKKSQQCYQQVQKLRGEPQSELSKQELAQRSLHESQPAKETENYLHEIKQVLNHV
ncbi:MAG: hypothetical protein AABY26_05360 [Nanoarchaeota archaeon]